MAVVTLPDPRRAAALGGGTEGGKRNDRADRVTTKDTDTVNQTDPRWGDVLDCVMACQGRGDCSWRPYECRLIGGGGER